MYYPLKTHHRAVWVGLHLYLNSKIMSVVQCVHLLPELPSQTELCEYEQG